MFGKHRGKLGEETSEKRIGFIQDSQQKRFEERWDQLVTKEFFYQEMSALRGDINGKLDNTNGKLNGFRSEIHKEFRTQLRWLLPLLFGQLGILLALLVKIFLDG